MRKTLCCLLLVCQLCPVAYSQPPVVQYQWQGTLRTVQAQLQNGDYYFPHPLPKRQIRISTLNWPPYIASDICQQGWVQQLTIALLHSQGYAVTSGFRPWARAVQEAELGTSHLLYPEYFIEKSAPSDVIPDSRRRDHLALSVPFPGGEIAFMKRTTTTLKFDGDLTSLKNSRIGVVRGYQNTPEFDRLWDKGFFTRSVEAVDDLQLGKMLLADRLDIILGDPRVIRFTLIQSGEISAEQAQQRLKVLTPALQYNPLYYAISKNKRRWKNLLRDINQGLETFKAEGLIEQIRRGVASQCPNTLARR